MNFVKVPHSLNKNYYVENSAIRDFVKKSFAKTKGVKLVDFEVKINNNGTGFGIYSTLKKEPNFKYSDIILEVENKINRFATNLIGTKSDNIEMNFI